MARKTGRIIGLGLLALGGIYAVGESQRYGGFGAWVNHLSADISSGFGATASAVGTTASQAAGATPSASTSASSASIPGIALTPAGVVVGSAAAITAAAKQAGITSAGQVGADTYGALLWSLQSGKPVSAFAAQSLATRATFDAVAINGS